MSLLLQSGLLEPPKEEEGAAVLRKEVQKLGEERARHVAEVRAFLSHDLFINVF